jgi:hypothetical protein
MAIAQTRPLRAFGNIVYGVVAGFAATVVIVLGIIFLGFAASWIFRLFGWDEASRLAFMSGLYYVYFTVPLGVIVGLIVCVRVVVKRFRQGAG